MNKIFCISWILYKQNRYALQTKYWWIIFMWKNTMYKFYDIYSKTLIFIIIMRHTYFRTGHRLSFQHKKCYITMENAKKQKDINYNYEKIFFSFWFQLHCQNIDRRSKTRFTCYWIISAFCRSKTFHFKERKRFHKQETSEELCWR